VFSFDGLDPFESRRAKLKAWQDLGVDAYPAQTPRHDRIAVARQTGNHLAIDDRHDAGVAVAGRVMALRGQGALFFADLVDDTGKIQLVFKKDILSEELFERLALLDIADFLWASGPLFVTRRGELTVEVSEWKILSKALNPLPNAWSGLQDLDMRQRRRYLDLLVNDGVKERFKTRSKMVSTIRRFMAERDFVEVETSILEHIPGGADAEPFQTHYNALDTDFYLRISLELQLKRAVVGGFDRVFEIGKVFRNEGMSPQHLQEFTMFEFYWAYASYREQMLMLQEMFAAIAIECFGTTAVQRGEHLLEFGGQWPVTTYVDLLKQYAGIDIMETSDEQLVEHLKARGHEASESLGRGRLLDMLYKKTARPHLIQPQFIIDVPVEFSPLAKRKTDDPRLTERVLILVDGFEVGNGFSELNDAIDQRGRLEEQEKLRIKGDPEAMRMDADFLRALEHGMPPTTGFGVSIDRLMTVMCGLDSVRETVLFPLMRPEAE
jgi:lysyl-tRNA synthetase, class II